MSNSLRPHGARKSPLSMGIFPGKNIEVSFHFLLQGILLIQGSNLYLLTPALAGELFTTSATWSQVALVVKESAYQCRR